MSRFDLTITTNNAAFKSEDGEDDASATEFEVARLLVEAAGKVRGGRSEGDLLDFNGNAVGTFRFVSDREEQS